MANSPTVKFNAMKCCIVVDSDENIYPLGVRFEAEFSFMTRADAENYARHLSECHPGRQYNVYEMEPQVGFLTRSLRESSTFHWDRYNTKWSRERVTMHHETS